MPGDKTVLTLHQCNTIYAYMQQHRDVGFKGYKPNCPPQQDHQQEHMHINFSFTWAASVKEATQFNYKFWLRTFKLLQSKKARDLWAPFHLPQ